MTSLLMLSPPISISHGLFRCRYSNSRDVIASFPSFCQSAPESLLAGYFLRTPSAPITTVVVFISIFHLLALSVHIIRPPSLFLGRTDHDRLELQFWIPSSLNVNTIFLQLPQKLTMYFLFSPWFHFFFYRSLFILLWFYRSFEIYHYYGVSLSSYFSGDSQPWLSSNPAG